MPEIPSPHAAPGDSQHQLAMSIARAVRLGLPAPDSEDAIAESVEDALLHEACRNERLLAGARVTALATLTLVALLASLLPERFGLTAYPIWPAAAAFTLTAGAAAFLVVIRRGRYWAWLRRAVPAVDALIIAGGGHLFLTSVDGEGAAIAPGFLGIVAVCCAFVAFTGALRLSRRAGKWATGFAMAAALIVGWEAELQPVTLVLIGGTVLATGLLGVRFTRVIRQVITKEVSRLRLARLYADAQEAISAREEVLKIVSHDLRNPLNTIAMAADCLLDIPATEEQRVRQLGMIKRAGSRMDRLIHDLLDVARIETGRLPIETRSVEVRTLFDNVVEMMEPLAREKGLELTAEIADGIERVQVDSDRILQVFSNLIGNAVKFTPGGGRIAVSARAEGGKIRMAVADTGPGIAPDQLPKIFGRMWQARKTDTRGIGLGLTIAKAIIEAHGESIEVRSELGRGTEFSFTVAVSAAPARAPAIA